MYQLYIFLILAIFLSSASLAAAATLSLDSASTQLQPTQSFEVALYLDSQPDSINALEGALIFPDHLLELIDLSDGNSIVNFWVERPGLAQPGQISFSGVIPGGYLGSQGKILSLTFKSLTSGNGSIQIQNSQTLKNDGLGTPSPLSLSNFYFSIYPPQAPPGSLEPDIQSEPLIPPPPEIPVIVDNDPPENFLPQIASTPNLFDGAWFLVFAAQDKSSGIGSYFVKEGRADFVPAESPYLLANQNLDVSIQVMATDKSGNQKIVILPAKHPTSWYKNYWFWGIIILVILLSALTLMFLWRKKQKIDLNI